MTVGAAMQLEMSFRALPRAEREAIISYGAVVRLSSLRKRHFLAQSKVQDFEKKYHTTLMQLEATGLPDDADFEMHEDYVMWQHWHEVHWHEVLETVSRDIAAVEGIAGRGLYPQGSSDIGD